MVGERTLVLVSSPEIPSGCSDLNALLELDNPAVFLFRYQGAEWCSRGLLSGDFMVVRRDLEPREGDLLVVYLNGCYRLLEFNFDNAHKSGYLRLFGVVIGVFRARKTTNKKLKIPS